MADPPLRPYLPLLWTQLVLVTPGGRLPLPATPMAEHAESLLSALHSTPPPSRGDAAQAARPPFQTATTALGPWHEAAPPQSAVARVCGWGC